ncbi:oligosaccharide flippase family protein [Devosia aquimaris]|uniref:oligosaccharide flippase family protein n=1 Tax=Devosia aquimaris TaxID=2866214 RepID=UPI001CD0EA19|nr:oligosaccharide flippase family protein [Devosia sp. CJK-A8-3]
MIGSVIRTYGFFLLRTLIPLALLPALSHALGAEGFGIALTMQSLGLIGSLVVQYGFHVSASREIGLATEPAQIKLISSKVLGAQGITSVLATVLVVIGGLFTGIFSGSFWPILSAVLFTLGTGLSPAWYFRGTGRAATGIALEVIGQAVSLVAIVLFVRSPEQLEFSLLAVALGPVLSTAIGLVWLMRELGGLDRPSWKAVLDAVTIGFPLFLVRASSSGFTFGSVWIVGLLATAQDAAYFGVASKLIGAITVMSQPITFTLLPNISRAAKESRGTAIRVATKWGSALLIVALCGVAGVYVLGDFVIGVLFADDMAPAAELTKVLSWVCILVAIKETLGDLMLIPLHRDRIVAGGVMFGGASGLALALLLVPLWGSSGMVLARMVAEVLVILVLTAGVWTLLRSPQQPAVNS